MTKRMTRKYKIKHAYVSAMACNAIGEIAPKALTQCIQVQMKKWYGWTVVKSFPVKIERDYSIVTIGGHGNRKETNVMKMNEDSYEYACIQAEELLEMLEE